MMSTEQCSLFLCPVQSDFMIDNLSGFITGLQDTGFISRQIQQHDKHNFFTGEKYLDYIAYMGCAPTIQLEAEESGNRFCHIKIHRFTDATLIYSKIQARAPVCPVCKKSVTNWQQLISKTALQCERCRTRSNIDDFNWHKMAGYARLFIEITDIYPKEAIPQQSLLDHLNRLSKTDWQYFYSCGNLP